MRCPHDFGRLDLLLHYMRGIASSHVEWEANFARSVLRQAKWPGWKPSAKQLAIMEQLVGELFNETECEVLE